MDLLGLDTATHWCGWTCGDGATVPDCGAWELPEAGDDIGLMLDAYDQRLNDILNRRIIGAVAFEAPILTPYDTVLKIRKLYALGSHTEFVCRKRGLPCHEVDLRQVKKELTGNSEAKKDDMVAVARRLGLCLPTGPGAKDAADSLGVWLVLLREYDRAASSQWDVAIHSRSGRGLL